MSNQRILHLFLILLLVCLPGCSVNMDKEFATLQERTKKISGKKITYDGFYFSHFDVVSQEFIMTHGLSRSKAIGTALENNPQLQADFEQLGIAKADLTQAGLFTNPTVSSLFHLPLEASTANIEVVGTFRVADLWQVPLNRQVAQDILEIISLRILQTILDTIQSVSHAYNDCVYYVLRLKNAEQLLEIIKTYQREISIRKNYGYSMDLDIFRAHALLGTIKAEVIDLTMQRAVSFFQLHRLMGFDPDDQILELSDTILVDVPHVAFDEIRLYALEHRPEMLIADLKIKQYEDTVRLEKAKMFKDVDLGIAFKRDFEFERGTGPALSFNVPIFDTNFAQIARAKFLLEQAKKEKKYQKITVLKEVKTAFVQYQSLSQQQRIYQEQVIANHKHAVAFATEYAKTMQLPVLVALDSQMDVYHSMATLYEKARNKMNYFADLERAVGQALNYET